MLAKVKAKSKATGKAAPTIASDDTEEAVEGETAKRSNPSQKRAPNKGEGQPAEGEDEQQKKREEEEEGDGAVDAAGPEQEDDEVSPDGSGQAALGEVEKWLAICLDGLTNAEALGNAARAARQDADTNLADVTKARDEAHVLAENARTLAAEAAELVNMEAKAFATAADEVDGEERAGGPPSKRAVAAHGVVAAADSLAAASAASREKAKWAEQTAQDEARAAAKVDHAKRQQEAAVAAEASAERAEKAVLEAREKVTGAAEALRHAAEVV